MARKKKQPSPPPSKAYLVSFGDTMTALLAFFIVLNSFAKDQTGANMHSGTGSFVNAVSSIGLPGQYPGNRTNLMTQKVAPTPLYAIESPEPTENGNRLGPDSDPNEERIIDRQTDEFKRFLSEMNRQFQVEEQPPTRSQIVFDSFEKLRKKKKNSTVVEPLKENAIQIASEAISQLRSDQYELEIVVWATMPSKTALKRSMDTAIAIQNQIDAAFTLDQSQRSRISTSSKPWLFVDAIRPKISFVLSRMQ